MPIQIPLVSLNPKYKRPVSLHLKTLVKSGTGVVFIGDDSKSSKDLAAIFVNNLCTCEVSKAHYINKDDIKEFNHFVKWSRWKNHDNEEIFNVYGHTIFQEPLLNDYSCGVDLGCFYKNKEKLPNPRLCALEFPSMKIYTQESLED